MKRKIIIACDVDGVINALGDDNFSRPDMQEKMLFDTAGKPRVNLTFSPTAIAELNSLVNIFDFFMLTSWNARISELQQAGLMELSFLVVDRIGEDSEKNSKIQHVIALSANHLVIWIDDFAEEWFPELPENVQPFVHPIQPNHHQGFEAKDFARIMKIADS